MIIKQTIINNSDTSGLGLIKIFQLYGGFFKKKTSISFFVKGSLRLLKKKNINSKMKIKKGKIVKLILVSQKYNINKKDSSFLKININSGLYLKKKNILYSKHVIGPGFKNLNNKKILLFFKNYL